ncbi:16S rRNA (guanine(966)-N(2))-methyltransferase RsmD [Microbacterium sp. B2969]|uniref:16S rRNA (Guanine(966)-N(2))-methyltransferase RsmD n=1 Tax=Microbacterium alkaliflavum TaxID=3248839 RepID=A0ABW7Q5W8_9MICO
MTRIIAGRAGGTTLDVPGSGTRPTSDRVRESLFGALESADAIVGARVVDLYAGSGALGLEAVSRGAASADLVERAGPAATIAQRNAARVTKALGAEPLIRVHRIAVTAFLGRNAGPFDLAFLDPPYDVGETELATALHALRPLLSDHAVVVVERARRSPAPPWHAAGLEPVRDRAYGDTAMWWGQPLVASQSR